MMLHLVLRIGLEAHSDHGELAEHPGQRRFLTQRRRQPKDRLREIGSVRQRQEDVLQIWAALGGQPIVEIGLPSGIVSRLT